ncbi:hypothetical protein [Thermocoleostomius sinensis]|uniref:Uncharacterized protein n=1 Tax=Thermocoleostomius sinensis A174 TaxID=2016057 RepID=A0A9E8ZPE6_9CYAN|nr:hypothetical protein [Thermocoleostomius sinensis]WAL62426.1 hypothetical protein OXH18_10675 [Thermocoleostomius sinensis A174]
MKRNLNWERYKQLELIPDAMWEATLDEAKQHSKSQGWLNLVWDFLVDCLIETTEPRIREKHDRHHKCISWEAYDPTTGTTHCFSSKTEVLAWLERRHFR